MLVKHLHDTGEVKKRAAQPVYLVNHDAIQLAGFNIRQYRVGKYRTRTYRGKPGFKTLIKPSRTATKRHLHKMRDIIHKHRGTPQAALIAALNPVIWGWAMNHRTCVAKRIFTKADTQVYENLVQWAQHRHPHKSRGWQCHRYWRTQKGRLTFSDGMSTLVWHGDIHIVRHVKVSGDKSPYDGDWPYWGLRLKRDPTKPIRVTRLLKRQTGRCVLCGLRFAVEDVIEVHHWDGNRTNNRYVNLALLHGHCHDKIHG